eukprot:758485-Hanusia_phi.AAC.3
MMHGLSRFDCCRCDIVSPASAPSTHRGHEVRHAERRLPMAIPEQLLAGRACGGVQGEKRRVTAGELPPLISSWLSLCDVSFSSPQDPKRQDDKETFLWA